jgi:hypothetical protein
LGLNFTTLQYTYDYYDVYNGYHTSIDYDYSNTRTGFAVVAGLQIDLGSRLALDMNAKLNMLAEVGPDAPTESAMYIGFNIGVVFKF